MTISNAIDRVSTHRDVVPVYYHRPSRSWVITGVCNTARGAVVVDATGGISRIFDSKRDALASIVAA
jgi:hypothetical protein